MLRGVRAPVARPAPRAVITPARVPTQAIRMATRAARSVASMTNTRFSASRMRVAVEVCPPTSHQRLAPFLLRSPLTQQTNKLLSSRAGLRLQNFCVPKRLYAKDIEYPDWEQYERFDKYEYRGEVRFIAAFVGVMATGRCTRSTSSGTPIAWFLTGTTTSLSPKWATASSASLPRCLCCISLPT